MKILLVAFSYPPIINAQSIRWSYFTNIWQKFGIKMDIISPFYISIKGRINSEIFPFRMFLKRRGELFKEKKLLTKLLKQFAIKRILNIIEFFLLGEIFWDWNLYLKKVLCEIDLSTYQAIIISSEPHVSTCLPAIWIKHNNIILDIGDPPISNYFLGIPIFQRFHDSLFIRALRNSAKVVTTSLNTKFHLIEKFDVSEKKVKVIYQGFPAVLLKQCNKDTIILRTPIKLGYAGNFIRGIREPKELIKGLKPFKEKIKLFYIGKEDEWTKQFSKSLGNSFIFLGRKTHSETLEFLQTMDVLVYLGNKNDYQTPGKFFEYLGLTKPILLIYQNQKDESLKISKAFNIPAFISYNSHHLISKSIYKLVNSRKLIMKPNYIDKFSWETQSLKYINFILS
jgi:glycosyltransferase involved in cell wall biosynthesis